MKDEPVRVMRYGSRYIQVMLGTTSIGLFESCEGGYRVIGLHKVIPVFEDAVARVIQRRVELALREAGRFARALDSDLPRSLDGAEREQGETS